MATMVETDENGLDTVSREPHRELAEMEDEKRKRWGKDFSLDPWTAM